MGDEARAFAAADAPASYAPLVEGLCRVARGLSRRIARGPLAGSLSDDVGRNADGDGQTSLDVVADEAFRAEAARCCVRWYASEEQEEVVELDPAGRLALAIDPLDGSSNIDTNVSIGTIFSVYAAGADGLASVLRSARDQLAAGYFIYGPRTCLVVTFGADVRHYVLDPDTGAFEAVGEAMRVPDSSNEFAINASNYRHWSRPIRAYIDDCLSGADGPREADFNMRWIASLVAETHRILVRGGLFLYPEDQRPAYRSGRLRMVYECAPIALLVERAGGRATDGRDDILDQRPKGLHARTPFVFGSRDKVAQVSAYHDLPEEEVSALFGHRGLFRA